MMMDDSAPTHERRKFIKTYKHVFPSKNGLRLLKSAGRPTLKKDEIDGVEKPPWHMIRRKKYLTK